MSFRPSPWLFPLKRTPVLRTETTHDGSGGWTEREREVTRIDCRVGDPSLVVVSDQQGRPGTDLVRTLHAPPTVRLRQGDVVLALGLRLRVQSVGPQSDGVYFKALVAEDAPQ